MHFNMSLENSVVESLAESLVREYLNRKVSTQKANRSVAGRRINDI